MKSIYLEVFLIFDVFLAGMVCSTAIRHGLAHFRPHEHEEEHSHPQAGTHLPAAVREKLLADAQANFETVVHSTSRELQKDLQTTAEEIKKRIEELSKQAASEELEHYKTMVAQLQQQTKTDIESAEGDMTKQKTELKAKLAEEIAAEKKQLLEQIDTKLSDAMTSFLLEALGHDVDLGAQTAYLTKLLDEHKADFAREVSSEEA